MNLGPLVTGLICISGFMVILRYIENYLQKGFNSLSNRETGEYQGGEVIQSRERRYKSNEFKLIIYFTILHVIGFFGVSMYVLVRKNIVPINWTTIGFGAIVFYTILLLNRIEGAAL